MGRNKSRLKGEDISIFKGLYIRALETIDIKGNFENKDETKSSDIKELFEQIEKYSSENDLLSNLNHSKYQLSRRSLQEYRLALTKKKNEIPFTVEILNLLVHYTTAGGLLSWPEYKKSAITSVEHSDGHKNKVILIEEVSSSSTKGTFLVHFPDSSIHELVFNYPIISEDLDWYYERYMEEPFQWHSRAKRIREEIRCYGKDLFQSVFRNESCNEIYSSYKELMSHCSHNELSLEIKANSRHVDGLMWESLWDEELDFPLISYGVRIQRVIDHSTNESKFSTESNVLNILIVTARDAIGSDVDYQTVQKPIVEIVEKSNIHCEIRVLRPSSFEEFTRHVTDDYPSFYHIIHFDLHGAVLRWDELNSMKEMGKLKFGNIEFKRNSFFLRYGVDRLEEYEGQESFLFFEDQKSSKLVVYTAKEVSKFLKFSGIPVCMMNACQSAKQTSSYQSMNMGLEFATSGMQMVIALRYSISVSAVRVFVKSFYEKLLINAINIVDALTAARKELFMNKERSAKYDSHISLEDWVLPVLYFNKDVAYSLPCLEKGRQSPQVTQTAVKCDFIGRDLDTLRLERKLLSSNIINLFGLRGVGKSTFLKECIQWWKKTKFINKYFEVRRYYGDEFTKSIEHLLKEFSISEDDHGKVKIDQLCDQLNKLNCCVIFYDCRSIDPLDDHFTYFLNSVKNFYCILESDSEQTPIVDLVPNMTKLRLSGLDELNAFRLSRMTLEEAACDFDKLLEEDQEGFTELVYSLQGNPASIKKVIPRLGKESVEEVLDALW